MTNYSFTVQTDGLAFLTLQRKPVNALSNEFVTSLSKLFEDIKNNNNINCLIISSSIKHFCAGADLKERILIPKDEVLSTVENISECFNRLESLPFPTISAINRSCLGGGLEMALACDFRIASQNAIIGLPETSLGIIPGAGGTHRLVNLIGISKSKYWIFSSRKFTAEEAFIDGVIDFLSNDEELLETAIDLAEELLQNSPTALHAAKLAMSSSFLKNKLSQKEKDSYKITLASKDRELALEAFKNKEKPSWSNRKKII